jgi:pilus assembly protein CpaB
MGRRVMAVLAAMLVGLIGVAAVLLYASGADSRAVAGQRPQTVYVAQALVPSGTTAADAVAKGLMVPTKIAAKGVPAGALTTVDAATGKLVALTDIAAGDFVVASRFGATPTGQKAIQVPDGQVAISVSLSDPGRVGTFVTPGSHIVIYDTYLPVAAAAGAAAGSGTRQTRVLLDDALVIAVGSTSLAPAANVNGSQTQASATGALVTVALPPDTAAKLVHGIQTGTLYAGLRGTDSKANLAQIVSDSTLFNK